MPKNDHGPVSLRARWLGQQLRALREEHGLTLRHVAAMSGLEQSLIRRVECGQRVLSVRGVRALLDCCRIHEPGRQERLLGLAAAAAGVFDPDLVEASGWPDDDEPVTVMPASAATVARVDVWWLETVATRIRCYASTLIPDLLRVCEYQAAVLAGGRTPGDVHLAQARWLDQRRDRIIDKLSGGLQAVVTEQALRLPVEGGPVLARQLKHLTEVSRDPQGQVRVRVLATEAGWRAGMDSSFTVVDLPGAYPGPVTVTRDVNGPILYEGALARRYAAVFDDLVQAALSPAASLDLLTSMT